MAQAMAGMIHRTAVGVQQQLSIAAAMSTPVGFDLSASKQVMALRREVPISILPHQVKRRQVRIQTRYVSLSNTQWMLTDSSEFQATRALKQLGATRWVYPSALGTRFEHMIDTSGRATDAMRNFQQNQPELGITEEQVECVGTAALIHDIGLVTHKHRHREQT